MSKKKLKKSREICRSRYLISQDVTFKGLYLLNLLIKIIFLIQSNDNKNRHTH